MIDGKQSAWLLFLTAVLATRCWGQAANEASERVEKLDQVTDALTSHEYLLRYKFAPEETIKYAVEHLATVDTTIQGNRQTTKSRSLSTKVWSTAEVIGEGEFRFVHSVEDVEMWSEVSGRQRVSYNSRTDKQPPAEYEMVGETVGVPLSTVTIDAHGNILQRQDNIPQVDLGFGGLVLLLPAKPIKLGAKWSVPSVVRVRLKDASIKAIKTRQLYELQAVKAGIATISVQTQVLTPVNDARIRSQLVQRLSAGEIKFDVDAGRIVSKLMEWDEVVVGFNGPDSNMKYKARFTERYLPAVAETARKP